MENDIYSVQNLISGDFDAKSKGFHVEYYIRPPVTLTVDFDKYPLDLMFLELGLKVRQNQSNAIEIFVNNSNNTCQQIAKCFTRDDQISIVNNRYRPSTLLPVINKQFNNPYTISGKNIKFCFNVKSIKIKIISTLNSTVPCLRLVVLKEKK